MKKLSLFLALILGFNTTAQVEFREFDDWNKVLETAQEEEKFIFLDAYTDWCYWCKVADKELFSQEKVGELINNNFVPVKINFEDSLGLVLSRKFRVWSYPTLLYFNSEGEIVLKSTGYQPDTDKFMKSSEEILQYKEGKRYGFDSKELQPNFPDFYVNSLTKGKAKESPTQEMITSFLDEQKDKFSEESWSVMYRFPLNDYYEMFFVENFDKYKSIYGKEEAETFLYQTAYYKIVDAASVKNEELMKKWCDIATSKIEYEKPQDISNDLCMTYFQKTEEYEKYFAIAEKKIESEKLENTTFVNTVAWTTYEKIDNKAILNKATEWMQIVVEKEPKYAYLDTYAALLLKSGKTKKGKKWAKKAIALGKANGESVEETENLLKKFLK